MAYQEKSIGEGVYAADENNERNSERGTFVRSGGAVTVGASSSSVVLNVDAADIRVDATDYSAASGSVTLSGNSTQYPRRDLVLAEKGPTTSDPASFAVKTGTPIDQATFDTLVNEGVIEGSGSSSPGYPIHPAANIPEVQPPPNTGERQNATVLAMVYVPPGTADSTDLSGDLITDLRMEGIGVGDVLRSGDAVTEVEEYAPPGGSTDLAVDIAGAAAGTQSFGGSSAGDFIGRAFHLETPRASVGAGGERDAYCMVPQGYELQVKGIALTNLAGTNPNDLLTAIGTRDVSSGSFNELGRTGVGFNTYPSSYVTIAGSAVAQVKFLNNTNSSVTGNTRVMVRMVAV